MLTSHSTCCIWHATPLTCCVALYFIFNLPYGQLVLLNLHQQQLGADRKDRVGFLTYVAAAHPLQCFQMKLRQTQSHFVSVFIPAVDSWSYFPISSNIFRVLLALWTKLLCFCLPGLHINTHFQPLTASRGWSNANHPTHLSGHSFRLAVALWFNSSVSMSAAFL